MIIFRKGHENLLKLIELNLRYVPFQRCDTCDLRVTEPLLHLVAIHLEDANSGFDIHLINQLIVLDQFIEKGTYRVLFHVSGIVYIEREACVVNFNGFFVG